MLSLPAGTEMFQFPTSTFSLAMYSLKKYHLMKSDGFPHSEIFGSKLTYSSPKHIGVSPVLHQLLVPRHSPCALVHLTKSILRILRYGYNINDVVDFLALI